MFFYEKIRSLILPLVEIDKNLPAHGTIYDLGCGQGVIAEYLAKKKNRLVIGVDIDNKRIPANQMKNLSFINKDIRKFNINKADGVVLSDVLHHLNKIEQTKILYKVFKGLKKSGVLIIKEIDTKEFVRSRLSRLWDLILYPKDKIEFRNSDQLISELQKIGFKVKISRPTRLFPGSTTLFVCTKS